MENGVQFGDLPEFCDFGYIARVARMNAAALWSLAKAPGTPKDVFIDTDRPHQRHRPCLAPRNRSRPGRL